MDELSSGGVQIYKFPVDDEKEAELNSSMNVSRTGLIYSIKTIKVRSHCARL